MKDMELLKAMLAKINTIMKSNLEMMKSNQKNEEANRKANDDTLKEMTDANMKSNQEYLLARIETNKETD
jgi:hypothetical protein